MRWFLHKDSPMFAYLATCAGCGYSLPPVYYLCRLCWDTVAKEDRGHSYDERAWPVHALWEWDERNSLLHRLLQRRKGANIASVESRLALWMVHSLSPEILRSRDAIFFPSKKAEKRDHTWHLAHAVGKILDVPVAPILVSETSFYKTLSRAQRLRERSKNPVSYTRYKGERPLLIDDIVTTGATLEALWVSLGRPKHAVSLCLAYKTFNPEDKI